MELKTSPLAPASFPKLPPIAGVRLGAAAAGIKYKGRTDITLMTFAPGTQVAGVFTKSTLPGAPVVWCRDALKTSGGVARALVVKAGNANVFTADSGAAACTAIAVATAQLLPDTSSDQIMLSATGVIGVPLPYEKVLAVLPTIQLDEDSWEAAANAIRTTDTFAKGATAEAKIGEVTVRINGITKGSGMIEPNMATMLAYIATDAALPAQVLQALLGEVNETTFNAITVDSDTSTSDTVLLFATGTARTPPVKDTADPLLADFKANLHAVMLDLAQQIVRDGEGAQKFITVKVTGATDETSARLAAKSIANSPLVKTAIAGEDANWGRIVMAVGKTGIKADEKKLQVIFGGQPVTELGGVREGFDEAQLTQHLQGREIDIEVDLGLGSGSATVWTCDLTHGYIDINADYRS